MQKTSLHPVGILCVYLTVGMFCATGAWSAEPVAETPAEAMKKLVKIQRQDMKAKMEAEGFTQENNYMQGRLITGPYHPNMIPYQAEYFPYQWNYDDGTLCGIAASNNVQNIAVANGVLRFNVTGTNAYFSWGNFATGQAGLRFGYGRNLLYVSPLSGFLVRLRQSATQSVWQVSTRSLRYVNRSKPELGHDKVSEAVTVSGTNWQTVDISCVFKVQDQWGPDPWPGFRLISQTPGNTVEIDWIKPYSMTTAALFRKTLELNSEVRWAKCSVVSWGEGQIRIYVNGKPAVDRYVGRSQLWNFELDPALFHKGKNSIALVLPVHGGGRFLLDGALLGTDGSYQRFDSDESWKSQPVSKVINFEDEKTITLWTMPEYNDSGWTNASLFSKIVTVAWPLDNEWEQNREWFNPSWKGRLMVAPSDGRSQPVFGSKDEVALKVAWPASNDKPPEVTWQVFDEMGDGFHAADKLVAEGKLELKNQKSEIRNQKCADYVGELKFPAGKLPVNVAYAVVFKSMVEGKEVEKYRYEIAVCGPVIQPIVENPTNYTDGMKLKLVWEVDAAAEPKPGEFISIGGVSNVESTVITTPLGKFRQPYAKKWIRAAGKSGGYANFISWKYRIAHPGKPHLAIAEYPDDTERTQEMRVTEGQWLLEREGSHELGNHTAILGRAGTPLTQELRQHQVVFWPSEPTGAVTFLSITMEAFTKNRTWDPSKAARVGKIRIYEILNDVPMRKINDAPGAKKWIGQQPERGPTVIMASCFASPVHTLIYPNLFVAEAPNFYRNWMVTYLNMIKRLRFAGENSFFCGQWMYSEPLSPSIYSDADRQLRTGGSLRDYGVLMGRMFDENGMGFFTATELCNFSHIARACSDDDVARGADTVAQVYRDGHQGTSEGSGLAPNWLHPTPRKYLETLINEWIALYGKEPGWKGLMMYIDTGTGPSWTFDEDQGFSPYGTSYDDFTIGLFEKETGVKIPVDAKDMKRFAKRYDWLMANAEAKEKWTDWRCRKMIEVYGMIADRLQNERQDLRLILAPNMDIPGLVTDFVKGAENYMNKVKSVDDVIGYNRSAGLDVEAIRKRGGITMAIIRTGNADSASWLTSRRDEFLAPFGNDGVNGINHRVGWIEAQPTRITNWVFDVTSPETYLDFPAEYFADTWVNQFIRANPAIMPHGLQDCAMWMGHEYELGRFAAAFRSLPAAKYTKLAGNGRDVNVWISVTRVGEDVYGYVANRQGWALEADVTFAPGARVTDLITGQAVAGGLWKLRQAPYTISTFKAEKADPQTVLAGCVTRVTAQGQQRVRDLIQNTPSELDAIEKAAREMGEMEVRQIGELGLRVAVERMLKESALLLARNDYAGAYDALTSSLEAGRVKYVLEPQARIILYGYPVVDEAYRAALTALSKKEYAVARKNYRQVAKIGQGEIAVQAQLRVGDTYRAEKDYEKAKAEYLKVMTLPNANALHQGNAWNNIAGILQDEKNPVEAKQYQDKSRAAWLQAGDDTSLSYRDRTEALYKVGEPMYTNDKQYAGARAIFNKILMLKTPDQSYLPNVQYYLGYCWFQEKNYVEARKAWQKDFGLRNMDPMQKVRLCLAIGDSYKAEGKNDEARAEYNKVADIPGVSAADKKSAELRLAELH